ncbi:MAG: hypothetical protein IJ633_09825 [Prevotella sp.]|nr:hypothetical protein [Prevotella sp.]
MAKQLKDEGWKVFGSGKTIKEALDTHYNMLSESHDRLMTIEGHAKAKNVNLAVRKAQYQAAQQYASMRETKVEGTTETHLSNSQDGNASSSIDFRTNYKSSTEQTVKSLSPTVVFYRTLRDEKVEVWSLFLVDILK